jgi:hypothetical protein
MGPPIERLQASLEKCMTEARTHAVARTEKFDARWKTMLKNQSVQINLLKATTTGKKRNTDWPFLMAENPEVMDEKVQAWYAAHRDIILNQLEEGEPPAAASSPNPTPSPPRIPAHQALPQRHHHRRRSPSSPSLTMSPPWQTPRRSLPSMRSPSSPRPRRPR